MNKKLRVSQLWYSPEQYDEVKSMMDDAHLLPDAYRFWKEGAEQREEQARSGGAFVIRVPFDPAEFRSFCAYFGFPLNAESRVKLAIVKSNELYRDKDAH